jgi:predicted ATP-grasp superfamily ATP-dependent carboligase
VGRRIKVLLTGGEHFGGLAATRALARAGLETVAAVTGDSSYAARSRFAAGRVHVPDPAAGALPFVHALAAAAERLEVDVVLPGTDVALAALAAHAEVFPATVALGVCSPATVERATTKTLFSELAAAAGILVPPTQTIARDELAGPQGAGVTFPVVLKTVRSDVEDRDGTLVHAGAFYVEDAEQLGEVVRNLPGDAWLVQPYVSGELIAVAGVALGGTVIAAIHQVAERIWPADCGGSSYAITIPPNPTREAGVRRLVAEVGWTGIFQLQLLRSGNDEFLIDFNPRLYGTLELATAAGINLPVLWVDLLRGVEPDRPPNYRVGVRFRAGWKDLRALAQIGRDGRWREAAAGIVPRPDTCHPVLSWSDPGPALAGVGRIMREVGARAAARGAEEASRSLDKTPRTS